MLTFIRKNKEAAFTGFVLCILLVVGVLQQVRGVKWIDTSTGITITLLLGFFYVCAMALKKADYELQRTIDEITATPRQPALTTSAPVPESPTLHPLPEHQKGDSGSFYSAYATRQLGKSQLMAAILQHMSKHHLTITSDERDQQSTVQSTIQRLGGADKVTMRLISRRKVTLIAGQLAHHIMCVEGLVPDCSLRGIVFESVELSDGFRGTAPEWFNTFKIVNVRKLSGELCSYPRCNCPSDHPGTPGWCMRGLPTGDE
jgi:hypothetical protein